MNSTRKQDPLNFTPSDSVPYSNEVDQKDPFEKLYIREHEIHDTQEIMDIYMQRPKAITYQSLGMWFSKAHCLKSKELEDFGTFTIQTRRFLVEHRLTNLSLEPLEAYNKAWLNKEPKK